MEELKTQREEHKNLNDKENSLAHRWLNFTSAFSGEAYGKRYRPESVSFGAKHVIVVCCYKLHSEGEAALSASSSGSNRYKKGESKFKGGDKVIKRLVY